MLRFYVTGGQVDNKHTAKVSGTRSDQLDSLNVGGMFEAWF
ncbi:Maltoporin (phage lambda and maltose receptor) [Raoultella terrigena]|uniref:Maltoporin (Phage lambda and maltose receptor) n=1 Tax=Raoultella terrigena TaxID=577 RepID=A0A3P8ITR4_RAOTE|nr:Maltoporin (phage lambda and maltose receptor) [Raoultella terrigena]